MTQVVDLISEYSGKPLGQRSDWYASAAEAYVLARPAYPDMIIKHVISQAGLHQHSRILEIGCGPGTATAAFAKVGCKIDCVEPNPVFCGILQQQFADNSEIRILNSGFEDADVEAGEYDLVLAATSFHWISPAIAYPKAHHALKATGKLALLWNKELLPSKSIFDQLSTCYQGDIADLPKYETDEEQIDILNQLNQITITSGCFSEFSTCRTITAMNYSTERYLQLLASYSPYLKLDDGVRASLFNCLSRVVNNKHGGNLALRYHSACQIAVPTVCSM